MCVKSRGEGKVETMAERVKSGYALKVDDNTIQYWQPAWKRNLVEDNARVLNGVERHKRNNISTPYELILMEFRMWFMDSWRVAYKKLMLYHHNIMHSSAERVMNLLMFQNKEDRQCTWMKEAIKSHISWRNLKIRNQVIKNMINTNNEKDVLNWCT